MATAPDPSEIFHRAAEEGERRLDQSLMELMATGFIAGFTIVFGIAALGILYAAFEPSLGEVASVTGALGFAIGLVFLVVGRAELFTENFFGPTATIFDRREHAMVPRLLRLWGITLVFNLIGGGLLVFVIAIPGALPHGTGEALSTTAEEVAARGLWAGLGSAVIGGALVALLSFLLHAVNSVGSRIVMAYLVGFLLALGPFDHVIVTVLHIFAGILFGAPVDFGRLVEIMGIATVGNVLGGVGLVMLSHAAQARGTGE
ncbi:MAG: formate/nitrite transporter family protein [Bacteroidota bacterium]